MKISIVSKLALYLACVAFFTPSHAQTNHLDGQTKLVNPTGRTLLLERDNEDSWLTFHDPGDAWYSLGLDKSDGTKLKLNYGETLGATNQFTLTSDGKIGIGTANPQSKLDVHGDVNVSSNYMNFQRTGSPSGIQLHSGISNSSIQFVKFGTKHAGLVYTGNQIVFKGMSSTSDHDPDQTLNNSEPINVSFIGKVNVGTTSSDAKLTVKGDIHAEEVRVDLTVPGPDYVFEEDYDLPTLESIESYTQQNKHLPGVPSAQEMEENGIDLGVMDMLLLKKVEELTLYLIEQNELIDDLKHQNEQLEKRVKLLESKPVDKNE